MMLMLLVCCSLVLVCHYVRIDVVVFVGGIKNKRDQRLEYRR